MTVPQHGDKHAADALITPEVNAEYAASRGEDLGRVPPSVIVTFQRTLFEHVLRTQPGEEVTDQQLYSLYSLADEPEIGVVGDFGIGAPITAMVAEELIEYGVERLLAVGLAGSLDSDVAMAEPVVCTRALRDEGVSHHYLEPGRWIAASERAVARCERALHDADEPFHVGPTWTTSAPYRETVPEVERYATEGILTVEMEAAALFAVARYRDVGAGAMFTVSDYLGTDEWEPQFHETAADLEGLFELACKALR